MAAEVFHAHKARRVDVFLQANSQQGASILAEPRKEEQSRRARLAAVPPGVRARRKETARAGLMIFHGSLNQSSRIQQIRFGESRTDQLQTSDWNRLMGNRDRDR
jgi:hypothetical protein